MQQERHDQCTLQIEQLRIEAEKARHRPETNTSHAQTEVLLPQTQSETAAKMGNDNLLRRLQGTSVIRSEVVLVLFVDFTFQMYPYVVVSQVTLVHVFYLQSVGYRVLLLICSV